MRNEAGDPVPTASARNLKLIGAFALIVLGYMAMGFLGTGYAGGKASAPIWPAAGIALAALIVGGIRFWPAVWIGSFAVSVLVTSVLHWSTLVTATGSTLGAAVPALLLRHLFGIKRSFESPLSVVGFVLLVLLVGSPLAALVGTGVLNLAGRIPDAGYLKSLYTWWAGDSAGVMLVCPLIVSLADRGSVRMIEKSFAEVMLWTAALMAVSSFVFFDFAPGVNHSQSMAFLPFPLIVAIAWTFGSFGGAWATFVVGSVAMVGTTLGRGPLSGGWAGHNPSLVLVFIITAALTALLLGAYKSDLEATKERVIARDRQLSQAQAIGGIGSWFWDIETDEILWSAGSHRLFGLAEDRAHPNWSTLLERIHPDDRGNVADTLARIRRTGETETWECRITRADGEERVLLSTAALQHRAVAGTTMDITQRKRLEAQQSDLQRKMQEAQKLESLGLLAGGVAHDFNNILTGVLGNANLMRLDLPPDSPHIESLRKIEAAAERAADLCRQMLAYAGKGRVRMEATKINDVVRESWSLLQTSIRGDGTLTFEPGENLPPVIADPSQIQQVLVNLVLNAAEALPKENGRVSVRTGVREMARANFRRAFLSPELPDGNYVYLEVGDNGTGMSREVAGRIFDPFFTTKFTGRGLGLPAVAGIVRAHNGAIFVQSRPKAGTVVEVDFPVAKAAPPPSAVVDDAPLQLGQGRVLVVDDERTVRDVASEVLARAGFSVDVAIDGVEAVALVRANPGGFSFILIDLTMPRMNGADAIAGMRAIGCDAPIIVMSGFDRDEMMGKLRGSKIAGFVSKPFTPDSLRAAVRQMQSREA